MPKLDAALRKDYNAKWYRLTIRPEWRQDVAESVNRIVRGKLRYEALAERSGVPWYVIGLIHELESGCRFHTHLHNGDLLTSRTKNVPSGRPTKGKPPFSFEESAMDALVYDSLTTWKDWTIAGISYKLEGFNGFGYRNTTDKRGRKLTDGRPIASPYLYSGSTLYTKGKYVADGIYDRTRVSKQVGTLVILKALENAGAFTIPVE